MLPLHSSRWLLRALLLAAGLALLGCVPPQASAAKPSAPIRLTIEPQGPLIPGDVVDIVVEGEALADGPRFTLDVDLPETVAPFSGDTEWSGAAQAGRRYRLSFAVRVPMESGAVLTARATLWLDEQHASTVSSTLPLGPDTSRHAPVAIPRPRDGVIEYPMR